MCGREVFRRVGLTCAGGLAGIGLLLSTAIVHALPILSVDTDPITPGIQSSFTVGLGDTFLVDIVISGVDVGAPLNGFEFDLGYDASILTATNVMDGGFLLAPVFVVQQNIGPLVVEFAEVTLLPAGASGAGVLATVTFEAILGGTSDLDLHNVILSAPFGVPIPIADINDGHITVRVAVPEPTTILLLGLGLAGLGFARDRLH